MADRKPVKIENLGRAELDAEITKGYESVMAGRNYGPMSRKRTI